MKTQKHQLLRDQSSPYFYPFSNLKTQTNMKQLILLFSFSVFFLTAQGQLTKGVWLTGGTGSLYSYNETYNSPAANFTAKYTNIHLSASVGYFFIDKFSAGIRPTFSSNKGEVINGGNTNSYQWAVGPFVRYYFLKDDNPFNLLTDVSYRLGINKYLGILHEKGKYNIFSINGGTELFFNSAVGIEFLIGYTQQITSIENSTPGGFKSNKKGLQASIGFKFHLEKL
ncbi:MAG: hypothetical protein ACYCZO_03100 [Daejeonella sp.]